jgi:hypothetical protein
MLTLWNNNIGPEGAIAIAEALKVNDAVLNKLLKASARASTGEKCDERTGRMLVFLVRAS